MRFLIAIASWFRQLVESLGFQPAPGSRLFLYGIGKLHGAPYNETWAAIARVNLHSFRLVRTFPPDAFPRCSLVTSAASHGKNWLFLYARSDGSGSVGLIDDRSEYIESKRYAAGSLPYFEFGAVDEQGVLLLVASIASQQGGGNRVTVAEVLADGTLFLGWSQVLDIPSPVTFRGGNSLVGLDQGHAWLAWGSSSNTSTVYVIDTGGVSSSRTWDIRWNGMVFHKGVLVLYDTYGRRGEICRIDASRQIVTITHLDRSTFDRQNAWTMIARSPAALFTYSYGGGQSEIRDATSSSFPRTRLVQTPLSVWSHIVSC